MNEYIVDGRYPGDLAHEKIGATEAKEALSIARRIKETVRKTGVEVEE